MDEFNNAIPIICVSGPTASGKSGFAVELALKINGEIINADSVQVYRGFDIGSGKIKDADKKGVPHHLLSHVDPYEQYSAGRFKREALDIARVILGRGKIPIVVGGTGLYLRALFSSFLGAHDNSASLNFLLKMEERLGSIAFSNWCYHFLRIVDLESAQRIGPSDVFRLQRALSLVLSFGLPNKVYRQVNNQKDSNIRGLIFIIDEDTESLNKKIDQRVVEMINEGWIEEVSQLSLECSTAHGLKAIGYRHIIDELKVNKHLNSLDLASLINNIQRDTRRFAKRQRTWWRNQPNTLGWIPVSELINDSDIRESFCLDNSSHKCSNSYELGASDLLSSDFASTCSEHNGCAGGNLRGVESLSFVGATPLSFNDLLKTISRVSKKFVRMNSLPDNLIMADNRKVNQDQVFYGKINFSK